MARKYLVTGATGFIGSQLVSRLAAEGAEVRCLIAPRQKNGLPGYPEAEFVVVDLSDAAALDEASRGIDVVYHLAAWIRPDKSIDGFDSVSKKYRQVNVEGTKLLAEACARNKVRLFVYFSSVEAVGLGRGITEESPCQPVTDYGRSKFEAEQYILGMVKARGFPAIIIRPGLVYGRGNMAMLPLFRLAKKGLAVTIRDGSNLMPFCFIDDLLRGALLAERQGRVGQIYHITGRPYAFREFIKTIGEELGVKVFPVRLPLGMVNTAISLKELMEKACRFRVYPFRILCNKDTIRLMYNDWDILAEKAGRELCFAPAFDLKKGIRSTVRWYQENNLL
ncbi:MAG: NAD-dependent epimerase/dehydratase family protein [Candidatus Omnitrophica bacterium]|nr:NAD-dependent epimerase/dehydratase family protein [Candidatus Omnitrophota bacterium]